MDVVVVLLTIKICKHLIYDGTLAMYCVLIVKMLQINLQITGNVDQH